MPGTDHPTIPPEPPRRAVAMGAAAGLTALILVVVVAVLSAGSRGGAERLAVPDLGPSVVFDVLFAVMLVYSLVVMALLVVGVVRERGGGGSGGGPKWGSMILGMIVMGGLMALFLQGSPDVEREIDPVEIDFSAPETTMPDRVAIDGPPLWVWGIALLLAAVAAAVVWWTWRGTRRAAPGPFDPEEVLRRHQLALADLLDDAIDDLRDHPDARQAVIAAFARLQAGLEAVGIHRQVADTPLRYLQRVLHHVEVSAPAVEHLTEAYEEAEFSRHEITRATQLAAVDALVSVRDELRVLGARRVSEAAAP